MARIEIEMSEYQSLKKQIRDLNSALNTTSKDASFYKEKYNQLKTIFLDLENEGVYNRIFNWKKIIRMIKNVSTANGNI